MSLSQALLLLRSRSVRSAGPDTVPSVTIVCTHEARIPGLSIIPFFRTGALSLLSSDSEDGSARIPSVSISRPNNSASLSGIKITWDTKIDPDE